MLYNTPAFSQSTVCSTIKNKSDWNQSLDLYKKLNTEVLKLFCRKIVWKDRPHKLNSATHLREIVPRSQFTDLTYSRAWSWLNGVIDLNPISGYHYSEGCHTPNYYIMLRNRFYTTLVYLSLKSQSQIKHMAVCTSNLFSI